MTEENKEKTVKIDTSDMTDPNNPLFAGLKMAVKRAAGWIPSFDRFEDPETFTELMED